MSDAEPMESDLIPEYIGIVHDKFQVEMHIEKMIGERPAWALYKEYKEGADWPVLCVAWHVTQGDYYCHERVQQSQNGYLDFNGCFRGIILDSGVFQCYWLRSLKENGTEKLFETARHLGHFVCMKGDPAPEQAQLAMHAQATLNANS